jgi:copper resistance protein B
MTIRKLLGAALLMLAAGTAEAQAPAADAYYDPAAMTQARHMLAHHHGGESTWFLEGDRLEYQPNEGADQLLWDAQGWYGTDRDKLWLKSEGTYNLDDGKVDEAELQALVSRAVTTFFDAQVGIRHDVTPNPSRTYAVVGLQGLAPYFLELDSAAFLSDKGDVTARIEAEYDLLLTQRLILQPRVELDLAAQNVEELGIGAGLSGLELGLRLRYEVRRQFAPYIGVSWKRAIGDAARFARRQGEDAAHGTIVAGLRIWL